MPELQEWQQREDSSLLGTHRRGCRCLPDGQHEQADQWQTWA